MIDVVLLKDQPEAVSACIIIIIHNYNQKPSVIKVLFPDQTTATSDWRIWQLVRDLKARVPRSNDLRPLIGGSGN